MRDRSYQDRYVQRTHAKIEAIVRAFDPCATRCLDIGCNRGELCRKLLSFPNTVVTGLDLVDMVPEEIKRHPRFFAWQCDIAHQTTLPRYDVTFCLAVLHHVCGHHGWDYYGDTVEKVMKSAPLVFLEMGVPSEQGAYYWKDRILERFRTDEDWLDSVLGHPLVARWETIAALPIHCSVRHIYKIETTTRDRPKSTSMTWEEVEA